MKNSELNRWQQAFTLLELMLTLAIITILATLSLPALYLTEEKEAGNIFLQMTALLSGARAAAISRHSSIVICPGSTAESCDGNWTAGVLVFIDNNQNRQLDQDESLIEHKVWGADLTSARGALRGTLRWRVFGNRPSILISPLGEIDGQSGSLTWCPPAGSSVPAHQMVLNTSGRIRLATDENGDGLREDSQGRPLSC